MKRLINVSMMGVFGIWLSQAAPQAYAHGSVDFGDPNIVHACAKKKGGQLREITAGNCNPKFELIDHWNRVGPQGPPGQPGEPGSPGISGYERLEIRSPEDSEISKTVLVPCPGTKKALSCGAEVGGTFGLVITQIEIFGDTLCTTRAEEMIATPLNWVLVGSAVCANVQ